ncbi:MAG: DNA mismatch repair protein MutS, partial [Deltaproteobacteria bacterium]
MSELTPMLKQYKEIKSQYKDCILFFRLGDFYEMFFEDAKTASKILGIALTSRGSYNGKKVPMCGVPFHSVNSYIGKLIACGFKVAICEQVEDPKKSKGIVKREVIRVITPGSVIDETEIDEKSNLYIAALKSDKKDKRFGLSFLDLSTGEFRFTELNRNELISEINRICPAELLLLADDPLGKESFLEELRTEKIDENIDLEKASFLLKRQFNVYSLEGFGCHEMPLGTVAAGMIIHYLKETQKRFPSHIKEIKAYRVGDYMFLDESTCRHLELIKNIRNESKDSLFHILDKTLTPMGSRILKKWIIYPLINVKKINERLTAVSELKNEPILRKRIRDVLKEIHDIERLNGKICLGRATPKDLLALKESIKHLPLIKELTQAFSNNLISELSYELDSLSDIADLIESAIKEDAPASLKDGGVIKEGFNNELDELIRISRDGKDWIAEFAVKEQKRTGINNLKIGYNKVFGYYIEVSKSNLRLIPSDYIRKQTLVNAERFITPQLKEMEEKVLKAEEMRIELEQKLFQEIIEKITEQATRIKKVAEIVGIIDTLCALAQVAEENNYVLPEVTEEDEVDIREGRHPVVEKTIKDEEFVPNDIRVNLKDQQVLIITG